MKLKNFCKIYGIPEEIAKQVPCPEIENMEIEAKIGVISVCGLIRRELDSIENRFRNAPVEGDRGHAELMQEVWHDLRKAMDAIEMVNR